MVFGMQSRAFTCWKAWTKDCKFSLQIKARGTEYLSEVWMPVTYRFIMSLSLSFSHEKTGNFMVKCSVSVAKISYAVVIGLKKWLSCSKLFPKTSLKGHYINAECESMNGQLRILLPWFLTVFMLIVVRKWLKMMKVLHCKFLRHLQS